MTLLTTRRTFPIVTTRTFEFAGRDGELRVLQGPDFASVVSYLASEPTSKNAPFRFVREID